MASHDLPLPCRKGSPQYQLLTVPEHSPRGTLVGNVTGAVDADEGSNAIVCYFIAGGAWQGGASRLTLGLEATHMCPSRPLMLCTVPFNPATKRRTSSCSPTGRLLVLKDLDGRARLRLLLHRQGLKQSQLDTSRRPSPAFDLVSDLTLQEVRVVLEDIQRSAATLHLGWYTLSAGDEAYQAPGSVGWPLPLLLTLVCLYPAGVATDASGLGADPGAGPGRRHWQQQPCLL